MSLMQQLMQRIVRFMPDAAPDPLIDERGHVGQPISRVDGRVKVTGDAPFAAEFHPQDMAYAVPVYSTIARGEVTRLDTAEAAGLPGVIAVITPENMPRFKHPPLADGTNPRKMAASDLPVLQDSKVHWNGQPVAVVVAETLEVAEDAASRVRVEYAEEAATLSFQGHKAEAVTPKSIMGEPPEVEIGDAEANLAAAAVRVDETYAAPYYNHNAIEPHATTAFWEDDHTLNMFDATQAVRGYRSSLAMSFGLKEEDVRVVAQFVGGGFGGKAGMWSNTWLCAAAAKVVKRPVQLALSRQGVFRVVGGRTISEQRIALGATAEGHLTALLHEGLTATPTHARYAEQCTFPARHLYASDALRVAQKVVNLDMVANTWMRAPGESIGTFALESALDELAHKLGMDPIDLRRANEPTRDPTKHTPFSIRHLNAAYERGAAEFGWRGRSREPRSQRDGDWLIGQGVATAYYPVYRFASSARIRLSSDGSVRVQAAAHEMGMGTATVQVQHVADRLAVPIGRVEFMYGDSLLPDSPMAGGSNQTLSISAAVMATVAELHRQLLALAQGDAAGSPLRGAKPQQVTARDGGLYRTDEPGTGATYADILRAAGQDHLEVEATSGAPLEILKYSMASYGAQFCEVRVHAVTGEVRVTRWLGSFDCGRVINPKTARSQLRGGIVMGIGMALTEQTLVDERTGRIMNPSLAEYHVPVHLDVPHIDILFNDIPDPHTALGLHGIGEIGITGCAAALANAVFHATGKRIRQLPITLDRLL
jgi:xanthine dehydrogenase YagR molybdenum-binding subunit